MHPTLPTEELSAWIRLTLEPGLGPAQARSLLAAAGLPNDIYALSTGSLAKYLPHDLARQLRQAPSQQMELTISQTLQWLSQPNHHLLTLADPSYPRALLDTHDPPLVLYINGNPQCLERPIISMVGARSATPGGIDNAIAFAQYLAGQGWCIASGLASGIDTAAHQGALRAGPQGGGTIAILGTGIDIVYPASNRDLAHLIARNGALVSEFPLGTRAMPYQFPRRNRIVAGLAKGVLVVEAAKKSGSLITAKLASEMGREVFAIPGSIHSPLSRGCHALIRQGAKLVESGADIHEELGVPTLNLRPALRPPPKTAVAGTGVFSTEDENISRNKHSPGQAGNAAAISPPADPMNAAVLAALSYDPVHLDTLQVRTHLDLGTLNGVLLQLELDETVVRLDDGRFQRR